MERMHWGEPYHFYCGRPAHTLIMAIHIFRFLTGPAVIQKVVPVTLDLGFGIVSICCGGSREQSVLRIMWFGKKKK